MNRSYEVVYGNNKKARIKARNLDEATRIAYATYYTVRSVRSVSRGVALSR